MCIMHAVHVHAQPWHMHTRALVEAARERKLAPTDKRRLQWSLTIRRQQTSHLQSLMERALTLTFLLTPEEVTSFEVADSSLSASSLALSTIDQGLLALPAFGANAGANVRGPISARPSVPVAASDSSSLLSRDNAGNRSIAP